MNHVKRLQIITGASAFALGAGTAFADIEYREDLSQQGQGLGAVATVLVMTDASGCVARNGTGTADITGPTACPQGFAGGSEQPQSRTQLLSAVGLASWSEFGIVFNANETGANPNVTLVDMQVRSWRGATVCHTAPLLATDKGLSYLGTGVGGVGSIFTLTPEQAGLAFVTCGTNWGNLRVGLAATLADFDNGQDAFQLA